MNDPCGLVLVEFAKNLIKYGEVFIRKGDDVLPCVVTIGMDDAIRIYGMVGESSAEQRGAFKQHVARKDHAVAVLLFADMWERDENMVKQGEMLMGIVETRNGECSAIACKYTRDPLVFNSPIVSTSATPSMGAFDPPCTCRHVSGSEASCPVHGVH